MDDILLQSVDITKTYICWNCKQGTNKMVYWCLHCGDGYLVYEQCGHKPKEPHTCPYQSELYGDNDLCVCCSECEEKCNREI